MPDGTGRLDTQGRVWRQGGPAQGGLARIAAWRRSLRSRVRLPGLLLPLLATLLLSACTAGARDPAIRAAADAEIARRPDHYLNGEARAWQVRKDGAVRGLLWGTLHIGYGDDTVLPAAVRARFYEAADLSVESAIDREPDAMQDLRAAIAKANTAYDAAALTRLDESTRRALADVPGTDGRTLSLRGLAMRVLASPVQGAPDPGALPTVGFVDLNLIRFARQQNRPVYGLERPRITDTTLTDPNGPDAAAALRLALRRRASGQGFSDWARAAYAEGNVAGTVAALTAWQAEPDDLRRSDRDRDVVLTRRNAAWLPRLERRFARPGDHFVAVGAGHLLGTDGLVALLRARGYEVTPCVADVCR